MRLSKMVTLVPMALAGTALYSFFIRPWHLQMGTKNSEASDPLPGDDFTPQPWLRSTRAITIQAPAGAIYPWLVQIGQERGGFYSCQRPPAEAGGL